MTTTHDCKTVQTELACGSPSEQARAHIDTCDDCRAFAAHVSAMQSAARELRQAPLPQTEKRRVKPARAALAIAALGALFFFGTSLRLLDTDQRSQTPLAKVADGGTLVAMANDVGVAQRPIDKDSQAVPLARFLSHAEQVWTPSGAWPVQETNWLPDVPVGSTLVADALAGRATLALDEPPSSTPQTKRGLP
jgi:anti-sigma factor RsiW